MDVDTGQNYIAEKQRTGEATVWLALRENAKSLGLYEEESLAFLGERGARFRAARAGFSKSGRTSGAFLWQLLSGIAYGWGERPIFTALWAVNVWLYAAIVYRLLDPAYIAGQDSLSAWGLTGRSLQYSFLVLASASGGSAGLQFWSKIVFNIQTVFGVLLPALLIIGLARKTAAR